MSFATVKAGYTTVLSNNGYTEVKNLLEFRDQETPISYNHKYYVLKGEGFPLNLYASSNVVGTYRMRLEVIYENTDTTQRDANYELFIALVEALAQVSDFIGEAEDATFIDEADKQHTIGTFIFDAGVEGC